jgi:hypothetical protein
MLTARLHKIYAWIAFVLLVAWLLFASWQSSRHQPAETRAERDSATKNNAKPKESGFGNWLTHDAAGFFTFWLVLVGGAQVGLFVWQLRLIKDTLAPAKEAADAAKLNAEAVIEADRARLFVRVDKSNLEDSVTNAAQLSNADDYRTAALRIRYTFKNHGRSPALVKDASHHLIHAETLPEDRDRYYAPLVPLPLDLIIDSNKESRPLTVQLESAITVADAKSIARGDSSLWFYGYVSYDDTFGWGRELRFVWQYSGGMPLQWRWYKEFQSKTRH